MFISSGPRRRQYEKCPDRIEPKREEASLDVKDTMREDHSGQKRGNRIFRGIWYKRGPMNSESSEEREVPPLEKKFRGQGFRGERKKSVAR